MRANKRRSLPDKQIAPNMSNSHMKVMMKSCNTGVSASCHSSVCSNNKTQEHYRVPQKTKRLKTIKQRNLIRGQSSNRSNQHRQQCERGRKDEGSCSKYQDCQSSCSLNLFRKEQPVAKPFPSQKPSIITEGRLTSIRGLFSHEVRSVNIERLVKEKKHEKQEGQATASQSPSPSCLIPHSTPLAVVSETSEEGISAYASKDQKLMSIEQTDCIQTNLEGTVPLTMPSGDETHNSAQIHKATSRSGSSLDQKDIPEAVILSSSEELVHKSFRTPISPCEHKAVPKKKIKHDQKQTNKAAALDLKHDLVNAKRLDTPVGSKFFKLDSPQFLNAQLDAPSPASFMFSSPTLDSKRSALGDEGQHRKPAFSSTEEAVSRLASGLCHSLDSFPLQRCRPLLTECRKVLLHQLQERHGSQLQHSLRRLHSHISAEGPRSSSDSTEQVWPSSEQNYLGNKQMYSIFTRKHEFDHETRKHEFDQQRETAEFQADNDSQKHCLQEGFCENMEVGSTKRQRKKTWEIDSPQDFFRKLRRPCQDTMSQWSITAQSQDTHSAKQLSNSQMFSLRQAFTEPQTSTPVSYHCTNRTLDPFFLEPQKQVKVGSGESGRRHGTSLPLLEQWRNDPDLNFLFQDENLEKSHSALGSLTELRSCSPHHETERVSVKPHFGAVSAFFPPEGFCYEPYYQFPHPSNSFKNLP